MSVELVTVRGGLATTPRGPEVAGDVMKCLQELQRSIRGVCECRGAGAAAIDDKQHQTLVEMFIESEGLLALLYEAFPSLEA